MSFVYQSIVPSENYKRKTTMRFIFSFLFLLFLPFLAQAQFSTAENGLTIIVTDGTEIGKKSIPQAPGFGEELVDPIRPLGMSDAIQAAAFLDRPVYGKAGFLLIFCVNDSIGDQQGILIVNGKVERGVYRLIRQKISIDEEIPEGMLPYRLSGKVYLLGLS